MATYLRVRIDKCDDVDIKGLKDYLVENMWLYDIVEGE